jgi:hypothetical protein
MIVAQQLTAGIRTCQNRLRERAGISRNLLMNAIVNEQGPPAYAGGSDKLVLPSDESLGYFQSSAKRGLRETLFVRGRCPICHDLPIVGLRLQLELPHV